MNETLLMAFLAGILLGVIFFAGLWWTVLKVLSSKRPGICFIASLLLRTGIALSGFYFVGRGDWKKLLVCFAGFMIARLIVNQLVRKATPYAS